MRYLALAAALAAGLAGAQTPPGGAGSADPFNPMQKRELQRGPKEEKVKAPPVFPFAEVLYSAFKPEDWTALKLSTSEPKQQLSYYVRNGYYRQELVLLALIGLKSGRGLPELAKRREKGDTLKELAEKSKLDYLELWTEAEGIKLKLDKQAVPLEEAEASSRAAKAKERVGPDGKKREGPTPEEEYDEP